MAFLREMLDVSGQSVVGSGRETGRESCEVLAVVPKFYVLKSVLCASRLITGLGVPGAKWRRQRPAPCGPQVLRCSPWTYA